jgi:hypothetical protein
VNGTLYSLLAHPQLNREAKRMELCGVLEFYLKVGAQNNLQGILMGTGYLIPWYET